MDYEVHNKVRKIIYNLIKEQLVGIESSLLPQHISLKQSFYVSEITEVEKYFNEFVVGLSSFEVTFKAIDLINMKNEEYESQILWLEIQENKELREIHNSLNSELMNRLQIPNSGFDGDSFQFHSTLTLGYNQYKELLEIKNELTENFNEMSFQVKEIAMFYSVDEHRPGRFITHKILPLMKK
ncbi:2'-5' RNA ligase family protein [Paenibacillus dokdonensis]|uniref:2'-5' RNA ligase family protein n=1 Tax=Paenibacillus dokdonensis TaxID=2567944 RepID=UPI003D27AD81